MVYRFLKFILSIGIRFYYKEIKINNKSYLSQKDPLIIIANHPNTLMDAWVIGMIYKQPIYYMAKATLFDSKFKLKILRSLNMIPINRQGEGITSGVDNTDSLQECYDILSQGKTLLIFPEGTSYKELVLRKLKTGTARVAMHTEQINNWNLNLKIVAVGLNYSEPERFRSRILINIDKPQTVLSYKSLYEQNKSEAAKQLTQKLRTRLENVLLTTESKEEEELVISIHNILNSKYRKDKIMKGVEGKHLNIKSIKDRLDDIKVSTPWVISEVQLKVRAINWKFSKLRLRADFLDRNFKFGLIFRQLVTSVIVLILLLPLFFFGVIHNVIQFKFTDWIIPKLSKDIEYYAPFAVFIGLFTYPFAYFAFMFIVYAVFDLHGIGLILYLLLMPLSGLFAYWFKKYVIHISNKWHYLLLMLDRRDALNDLQIEKEKLRKLLFEE